MVRGMRNWAGNLTYRAARLLEPETVEQVQEFVRGSRSLRVLGSRHAFSSLADTTGDHLSLARLPRIVEIDAAGGTVTIDGAIRYGDLAPVLHAAGFALHNLASLPHISIAGACATGTHGSGDRSGNLSTAVRSMDVVRADGELVTISRAAGSGDLSRRRRLARLPGRRHAPDPRRSSRRTTSASGSTRTSRRTPSGRTSTR